MLEPADRRGGRLAELTRRVAGGVPGRGETPLEVGADALSLRDPEPAALLEFLTRMEFRTLTARIAAKLGAEAPAPVAPWSSRRSTMRC